MSLVFNGAGTNEDGIVQFYEDEIGANPGDISGNTTKLKQFTSRTRSAWGAFIKLASEAAGTYQFDDSNHTDYPFEKTNIVSGQRDYALSADANGNLFLEISKVAILTSATATQYQEIDPVDVQSARDVAARFNDTSNVGVPYDYDKTGNGIIFGTVPNYNATNGLLFFASREASHFVYTDTTKKPGAPGIFHDWWWLHPAEAYARRNKLANYPELRADRMQMEKDIAAYFGRREKDVRKRITNAAINFH